jgi:threonine dehydratase
VLTVDLVGGQYSRMTDPSDPVRERTAVAPPEPFPDLHLVTVDEIRAAAERLRGIAVRTPLLPFGPPAPHDSDTPRVLVKPESLQPVGAFKIRGAYNAISGLSDDRRAAGVVSHSSGNHGQGVARASRLLRVRAVIVMPSNASAVKVARVRADGAEVVTVGPSSEERASVAAELAAKRGMTLVPPFDDPAIVAGQGTVGLEIVEQVAEFGLGTDRLAACEPDGTGLLVLVPVGGGGLAAGVATALKTLLPRATIWGVEPSLAADARESLAAGRIVRWEPEAVGRTIADGMRTASVGQIPFAHLRRYLDRVVTVEEVEIARAMVRASDEARLVLEPSGATALGAWLFHEGELPRPRTVVCVLSGGNVDPDRYAELIAWGREAGG